MPTINLTTALTRDDTTSEEDVVAVLIAKGTTMVVLCVVSISVGLVPIQLAKWFNWTSTHISPRSQKMVSILLGFGGGVLFSTTFLHLLPEVSKGVKELVESGDLPDLNFSLAEIFMCSGFFIMYLVEEVVHTYLRKRETGKVENNNITKSTNELVNENGNSVCTGDNVGYGHGHSHLPPLEESNDVVVNSIRGLLIVLGLSVHELFEGLAIGLESSASYVWYMFAAVAAHKFVIAFCIGVELITSKTKLYLSVIYICTFAVVSPLGIGVGMLLVGGESAAASGAMAVVLQGIATGTLLYVVFFEILHKHRNGLDQFLAILIGFVVMFGLQTGLLTSLLLCFGGGVLLFTTFIHLAPEVRESVERHQSEGQLADLGSISLAELLFCGGFFLVYLIEEVVHAALDKKNEPSESVLYRTLSLRKCKNGVSASTTTTSTTSGAGGEDSLEALDGVTKMGSSIPAIFTLSSDICEGPGACKKKSTNSLNPSERMSRETDVVIPSSTKAPSTNDNASVHGLLAVLALSFHAIFEGLTVGLEPSISSVIYLATAIATHKLVIAFCVGMELYVAGATTRNILGYLTAFSMVTPLGIIIGLALAYLKNDSEYLGPTPTILQGMAAGTLLYVVFFEVLAREKANEKSGLLQLAAIIVGFMVMLGIQLATSHSHAHGGGGNQRSEHNHGRDDDNHNHEQENGQYKNSLDDAIYRLTEKMTEVVSSTIASTISDVHT